MYIIVDSYEDIAMFTPIFKTEQLATEYLGWMKYGDQYQVKPATVITNTYELLKHVNDNIRELDPQYLQSQQAENK